jgi:chorismate synthase
MAIVPQLEAYMDALRKAATRCGARIACEASGVPAGLGEPLFDKLDADIAYAMMGINAVKGVEIGDGFGVVAQRGSEHGDELTPTALPATTPAACWAAFPPGRTWWCTSPSSPPARSACPPRQSIDRLGQPTTVETFGRHDPCVGIRATPIAEAMLALVLMDHACNPLRLLRTVRRSAGA